jgi:hypothetical protein
MRVLRLAACAVLVVTLAAGSAAADPLTPDPRPIDEEIPALLPCAELAEFPDYVPSSSGATVSNLPLVGECLDDASPFLAGQRSTTLKQFATIDVIPRMYPDDPPPRRPGVSVVGATATITPLLGARIALPAEIVYELRKGKIVAAPQPPQLGHLLPPLPGGVTQWALRVAAGSLSYVEYPDDGVQQEIILNQRDGLTKSQPTSGAGVMTCRFGQQPVPNQQTGLLPDHIVAVQLISATMEASVGNQFDPKRVRLSLAARDLPASRYGRCAAAA